ncbi:MAG: hypothetical protein AB1449_10625 [Chloroflexota bacterium]
MSLINEYSFLLTAVVAIGGLAYLLQRDGARGSDWVALGSLALGFLLAYLLLQPGPSTTQRVEEVLARIGAGRPVLLELQSPY